MSDDSSEKTYEIPFKTADENNVIRYNYNGEEKEAVWRSLSNGMRLCVTVPISETKGFVEYDPLKDSTATDVMNRADTLMYENKRERKKHRKN